MKLTNEDMRARQQEGSYSVESAAAHTGQRPRRQEVLQQRSAMGGARKQSSNSTSPTPTVAVLPRSCRRERRHELRYLHAVATRHSPKSYAKNQ
jgi:hypothetical protein